jgi:hypothetical protein
VRGEKKEIRKMKKKENRKNISPALSKGEGERNAKKEDEMKNNGNKITSPQPSPKGEGEGVRKDENLLPETKTGSEHKFLPIEKGEYGFSREGVKKVKSGISTVFNIKKPSATGIYIPAEGCISKSRAIRACLMIRVFNN